jgi:hypothetical protein
MISSWRRTDDAPAEADAEAGLEGWISDLAGGETSVRRLRKRLEASQGGSDEAADVRGDDPFPAPDHQLAIDLVRLG